MLVPKEWDAILRRIQDGGFPEAVLAGGALRDLDNGRPVKDLDIFISVKPLMKDKLDAIFNLDGKTVINEAAAEYIGRSALADVAAIYEYDESRLLDAEMLTTTFFPIVPPVNVIAMNGDLTLKWVVERIDLGLCRAGYDGHQYLYGAGYATDQERKTMTVMRCESVGQLERTYSRFRRLEQKYPGFELVIPAEFAHHFELFVQDDPFGISDKPDLTNVRLAA